MSHPTHRSQTQARASALGPVRALLDVTRLVREERPLPELLDGITAIVADSLGFATVTINLYRPAWDDFEVVAVHGSAPARAALLGRLRAREDLDTLTDPRYERRPGAFFLAHETFDWDGAGHIPAYIPELEVSDDPDAWHPDDALLLTLTHTEGHRLGVLSVDEPLSGRRPTDEELDVLAAMAQHAALAVQDAQEEAAAARHRRALEELLQVSARVTETLDADAALQSVCGAVRSALGFGKVTVLLHDPSTGSLRPAASVGWGGSPPPLTPSMRVEALRPLLDERFLVEGCALVPVEDFAACVGERSVHYASEMNGRGPRAWRRHWLLVPLHDRMGAVVGVIWADDPADRLLPGRERLQALRAFANLAATAISSAAQFDQVRFLADHDALTHLGNRRAFVARLAEEAARFRRYGRPLTLVLCDLNGFKELNDHHGHQAGDEALCAVADVLTDALRRSDGAFRLGGDEFGLVLVEADEHGARDAVGRIAATLQREASGPLRGLSVSFGIAAADENRCDPETLYRHADEAMYVAKRAGETVHVAA